MNTHFNNLWFDPTGNRIRVDRFNSRRSISSTTDQLSKRFHHLPSRKDSRFVGDDTRNNVDMVHDLVCLFRVNNVATLFKWVKSVQMQASI